MEIPKKIYLQVGEDADVFDVWPNEGVTWCKDKLNDSDIEYIRTEQRQETGQVDTVVNGQNCWELCPMCEGTTRVIIHIDDDGANLADCWVCAGKGIISKHNGKPPAN